MTTVDQVVERARGRLMHGSRGPVYTVGSPYTAGSTSLVLTETPEHLSFGSIISVDYEQLFVQAVAVASKTLTVIPGYMGTTQANHSAGAVVAVDSRHPKSMFLELVEEELRSWGRHLPRVTSVSIPVVRGTKAYDLSPITGEIYYLLDVRADPELVPSYTVTWVGDAWVHVPSRLVRAMDVADFATGYAVQFMHYPRHDGDVRVTVAQPLNVAGLTSSTDLESTVGIKASWLDVLMYGVRSRAVSGDAVARSDWRAAGHSRDAEETVTLDLIRVAAQAADMRQERLSHEALEFRADWPYRSN